MRTWLKGGLYGILVYILLIFITILGVRFFGRGESFLFIILVALYVPFGIPFWFLFKSMTHEPIFLIVLALLINIFGYFIIGALIGLIIQKVKKK